MTIERLSEAGVSMVEGGANRSRPFVEALDVLLPTSSEKVLVHLDMDCIDPAEGVANEYAEPGGLAEEDLLACLDKILARSELLGLTVASYDPSQAGGDRIGEIAIEAISRAVAHLD